MNIDEQVLTAYALDELPIQHRIEVKAYLATHPEAAAEVEAIRVTASQLTAELSAEAASLGSIKKPTVPEASMKIRRSRRVEAMLAIAASVALCGGAAVVMIRATAQQPSEVAVAVTAHSNSIQMGQGRVLFSNESKGFSPSKLPVSANPAPGAPSAEQSAGREKKLEGFSDDAEKAAMDSLKGGTSVRPSSPMAGAAKLHSDTDQLTIARSNAEFQKSPLVGANNDAIYNTTTRTERGAVPNAGINPVTATDSVLSINVGDALLSADLGRAGAATDASKSKFAIPPQESISTTSGSYRFAIRNGQLNAALPEQRTFKETFHGQAATDGRGDVQLGRPAIAGSDIDREHNTESYDRIVDNAFLNAADNPLSTFSIDVDTASYSNLRRFLTQGQLPPKDAVRIEEMINYFPYRYEGPKDGDKPFGASVEVAGCPWAPAHRLVRVGIKGKDLAPKDRPASNLVFLIDVSGSMNEPNKLPLVKESLRKLVNKLDARDRVAMVVYAGNSGLVLPSTTVGGFSEKSANDLWHSKYEPMFKGGIGDRGEKYDTISEDRARALFVDEVTQLKQQQGGRQQILDAIDRLEAGGSTNGGAGIELAYLTAQSGFIKDGVNRVILATDGDFNVGVTDQGSLTRLIEEKAKGGTFLSVLGFGMGNTKDSTMEKLADKGNGNYAYIDTEREAQKVLVDQMSGTLVTIAKDVKIQVEFNPAKVGSYRLIGYENRMLAKEDFNNDKKDAGEIGAGHTVTALYEVATFSELTARPAVDPLKYQKPPVAAEDQRQMNNELLTLKIRYKAPDAPLEQGTSKLLEFPITDDGKGYEKASGDFKFASAVASFGMILRGSEYKGTSSYDAAIEMAQEGKGADENGYRAELIELIKRAKAIAGK